MKRPAFFIVCLLSAALCVAGMTFPASAETPAEADAAKNKVSTAEQPATNLRCWKKEACEFSNPEKNIKQQGLWDNESTVAKKECGTGGAYGYCYAMNDPINISISLPGASGAVTEVTNFGDYINKLYQYLLGFATTVAIVFTMVGGIRYVLAAGTGEVSEAKKQITNAISGLVLLMFAYLILFTVNPQLVHMQMPSIPKIRTVLFLTETSCEALAAKGYVLDPDVTKLDAGILDGTSSHVLCGGQPDSKIVSDPNGAEVTDDQTCMWQYCGDYKQSYTNMQAGLTGQKVCMQTDMSKTGDEAYKGNSCIGCWDVTTNNSKKITPSDGVCSYLSFKDPDEASTRHFDCQYTHDVGFTQSRPDLALSVGQCALVAYDCTKITTCQGYDTILAVNADGTEPLNALISGMVGYQESHQAICEQNPCAEYVTNGPCLFTLNVMTGISYCYGK